MNVWRMDRIIGGLDGRLEGETSGGWLVENKVKMKQAQVVWLGQDYEILG